MSFSAAAEQVALRFSHAPVAQRPFPWLYVRDVFPVGFYAEMIKSLPAQEHYRPTEYEGRFFCGPEPMNSGVWGDVVEWMIHDFTAILATRFKAPLKARFPNGFNLLPDMRLVRDVSGYEILPHTDHPNKVMSLLFYLPRDDSMKELGTAIYEPHDRDLRSDGMHRYGFENFRQAWRAPFMPNTCFGFFKTDQAFHGVPPIGRDGVVRDVLLFNVYDARPEVGLKFGVAA